MSNEFNLEYFMDKISVPSDKVNRKKLNELILGPTTSRIGVRQFVNKILQKPKNDFIVYVRNNETYNEGTWSKGQLLYCHLNSPTSDVIINGETKRVNDTDIQTQKTFTNNSSNEIGGRKKRTRKQKQKPSRKGKKTKKSRFSAKKSRINRKNKRKGKTNRKNN